MNAGCMKILYILYETYEHSWVVFNHWVLEPFPQEMKSQGFSIHSFLMSGWVRTWTQRLDSSTCMLSQRARLHLTSHSAVLQNGYHYGYSQERGSIFIWEVELGEPEKMPGEGSKKVEQKSYDSNQKVGRLVKLWAEGTVWEKLLIETIGKRRNWNRMRYLGLWELRGC